jgi:nicotinate-nucleotide adenylyltransferase
MSARLGIFGGTFDPIHVGHLIVSETARALLSLDRVVFVPARIPPHKGAEPADPAHRLRMTELACRDNPAFEVSDLELGRDGPSYTVETLRDLRDRNPGDTELYLLMGADSARDLETWKDYRVLLEEATVAVLTRAGVRTSDFPERVARLATLLPTPVIEISSSDIRRRVRDGGSIRYLVTDPVEKYVRSERLYVS